MNSWLLEINENPSLNPIECKSTEMGCNCKNCPISPVDLYVKKKIYEDFLDLVFLKKKINQVDDTFNSLNRIYPSEDEGHLYVHDNLKILRNFFYSLGKDKTR